jgi:hypothetical protein
VPSLSSSTLNQNSYSPGSRECRGPLLPKNTQSFIRARALTGDRQVRLSQFVLHSVYMSHTLTIRLTDELLAWLNETSRQTGIPVGRLVREQLEVAKAKTGRQRFLRHAGAIKGGPSSVSTRKGFSRT